MWINVGKDCHPVCKGKVLARPFWRDHCRCGRSIPWLRGPFCLLSRHTGFVSSLAFQKVWLVISHHVGSMEIDIFLQNIYLNMHGRIRMLCIITPGPWHLVWPDLPHNAHLSHFGHALCVMQYSQIFGVPKLGTPKSDAFSWICIFGICIMSISTVFNSYPLTYRKCVGKSR